MTPTIYDQLAAHQTTEAWDFREVLANFHEWRERFNLEFKLGLSSYAIAVEGLRKTRLGQFREGHNGFGFQGEIIIARRHVVNNGTETAWWRVLGTLLHEMLHGWQYEHGKPGKRNYHNVQFRRRAEELGLIIDHRGYTQYERDSPFMDLLERYGVEVPPDIAPATTEPEPPGKSKLKLWKCACVVRVRVAVPHFRARCLDCGQMFELQD